jgi:hypothetical protein
MATKSSPKLSIQDQNEWLEHDPVARFINNSPFHNRNKLVPKQVLRQELSKMYETTDPRQITKDASGYQKKVATVGHVGGRLGATNMQRNNGIL